ncbi:hypothetical protein [Neolewinella antarctica]|uniref:Outer membrane protein beta-barrel domain-containing protein n=1 Tax=Neolewinella antarctica TaxID=442734 RepID=A0ABX0XE79_9BACT|nr:hypothetical protein [Neolewinella antarctica]NJC27623.1 hypothetical protein [Neolewinella antarctica]
MKFSKSIHNQFTLLMAWLTFALALPAGADAQTQRRRIAVEIGYGVHQEAINALDGFEEVEFYEAAKEVLPITLGLNYRFTKRMSLYADYTQSAHYYSLSGSAGDQQQFSALTLGIMPLSGFLEFGLGYSRFNRENTILSKNGSQRESLTSETVHGANMRLRFDIKICEGLSVYAGAMLYGTLPASETNELDVFANGNVGVQFYLLGKDKKYVSRKERRLLREMRRERDLEELRELEEGA